MCEPRWAVRAGDRFEHRHYVVGDGSARRPDVCRVTRVTAVAVYFQTETGAKRSADRDGFHRSCVLRWLRG